MATIVGGLGLPHTPFFPAIAEAQGPDGELHRFYGRARAALEEHRPDVVVIIDTDHFNTFFFDNFPTFGIGVEDSFVGPIDEIALLPPRPIRSHQPLAAHLFERMVRADFDVSLVTHYEVGHSVVVPLHFVTPEFRQPVIPIFLNGHLPPMPSAARSHAFGKALGDAIRSWPEDIRVEVIGTGSFSLDVAGPRMFPDKNYGVPAPEWSTRVQRLMLEGRLDQLIEEATEPRMLAAGNVGGEVLNWIAMMGAVGATKADWMQDQPINGHAYAAFTARTDR